MLNDRKSRFAARIRSEPRMRPAHSSRRPQIAAGGGIWRITSRWYAFRRSLWRTAKQLNSQKNKLLQISNRERIEFFIPEIRPRIRCVVAASRRSWPEVRSFASKVRNRGTLRPTGSSLQRGSEVCSARTPGNILARDTLHGIASLAPHRLVESFLRPVPWLIAGMGESREAARF
jgi:hypothetical protein